MQVGKFYSGLRDRLSQGVKSDEDADAVDAVSYDGQRHLSRCPPLGSRINSLGALTYIVTNRQLGLDQIMSKTDGAASPVLSYSHFAPLSCLCNSVTSRSAW